MLRSKGRPTRYMPQRNNWAGSERATNDNATEKRKRYDRPDKKDPADGWIFLW